MAEGKIQMDRSTRELLGLQVGDRVKLFIGSSSELDTAASVKIYPSQQQLEILEKNDMSKMEDWEYLI